MFAVTTFMTFIVSYWMSISEILSFWDEQIFVRMCVSEWVWRIQFKFCRFVSYTKNYVKFNFEGQSYFDLSFGSFCHFQRFRNRLSWHATFKAYTPSLNCSFLDKSYWTNLDKGFIESSLKTMLRNPSTKYKYLWISVL